MPNEIAIAVPNTASSSAAPSATHLGAAVIALPSSAGLHASVYFRDRGVDAGALAERALAAGVAIAPLAPYYSADPRAGLALGYGMIAAHDIDAGIRALAGCLPRSHSAPPRRRAAR